MRYDTPVYFQLHTEGKYNPETGDYGDAEITEAKRYASVMDTQKQTLLVVYGEIRQGSLTIQLQNAYKEPFDAIRVGEKVYKVDYERSLRQKNTFIVSEVQ